MKGAPSSKTVFDDVVADEGPTRRKLCNRNEKTSFPQADVDDLPTDVLNLIFQFERQHQFCLVNERWNRLVHLKAVRCTLGNEIEGPRWMNDTKKLPDLDALLAQHCPQSLALTLYPMYESDQRWLRKLYRGLANGSSYSTLRTFDVTIVNAEVGAMHVLQLAKINAHHQFTTIRTSPARLFSPRMRDATYHKRANPGASVSVPSLLHRGSPSTGAAGMQSPSAAYGQAAPHYSRPGASKAASLAHSLIGNTASASSGSPATASSTATTSSSPTTLGPLSPYSSNPSHHASPSTNSQPQSPVTPGPPGGGQASFPSPFPAANTTPAAGSQQSNSGGGLGSNNSLAVVGSGGPPAVVPMPASSSSGRVSGLYGGLRPSPHIGPGPLHSGYYRSSRSTQPASPPPPPPGVGIAACMNGPSSAPPPAAPPTTTRRRAPSMLHEPGCYMLPALKNEDKGKITVVLDLDETLIFGRQKELFGRPYLDMLLKFLGEHCETVVWTAASKLYAQSVINRIDPGGVILHCIYRSAKWFDGKVGYAKDLTKLGRDLNFTFIVENTPDCIRGHEDHGVLVSNFEGGTQDDSSLLRLVELLQAMVKSKLPVPVYLSQNLKKQLVTTDVGDTVCVYCIGDYRPRTTPNPDLLPPPFNYAAPPAPHGAMPTPLPASSSPSQQQQQQQHSPGATFAAVPSPMLMHQQQPPATSRSESPIPSGYATPTSFPAPLGYSAAGAGGPNGSLSSTMFASSSSATATAAPTSAHSYTQSQLYGMAGPTTSANPIFLPPRIGAAFPQPQPNSSSPTSSSVPRASMTQPAQHPPRGAINHVSVIAVTPDGPDGGPGPTATTSTTGTASAPAVSSSTVPQPSPQPQPQVQPQSQQQHLPPAFHPSPMAPSSRHVFPPPPHGFQQQPPPPTQIPLRRATHCCAPSAYSRLVAAPPGAHSSNRHMFNASAVAPNTSPPGGGAAYMMMTPTAATGMMMAPMTSARQHSGGVPVPSGGGSGGMATFTETTFRC